jgi:hypothetical protein
VAPVSGDQLHVDPETIRQDGTQLTRLAGEMASELRQLQATVTGSGNPWGADQQGDMFAQLYGAVLGKALEALGSYVEQVGHAGAGLTRQAESYLHTEGSNTDGMAALHAGMGG